PIGHYIHTKGCVALVLASYSAYYFFFFFFSSRRRHTRSVSAFLLNRSSDLIEAGKSYCSRRFGGATCDDKSAQIYARFDKNDWRIQPAEFYRFHDAEVNTFGYF